MNENSPQILKISSEYYQTKFRFLYIVKLPGLVADRIVISLASTFSLNDISKLGESRQNYFSVAQRVFTTIVKSFMTMMMMVMAKQKK